MKTSTFISTLVVAAALAGAAAAAPPSVQVLIRHETKGCHAWSVDNGAFAAKQKLTAAPGTTITFTDNDVMPHRLVQLAGPKATLRTPNMHTMSATASVKLLAPGTYVFGTKAGEDYFKGVKTVGPDNVLRLTVVVK
jgi:plastocyanin